MKEQLNMQKNKTVSGREYAEEPMENMTENGGERRESSTSERDEAVRMALWARMAERRKDTPCPDVDAEWRAFQSRHSGGKMRRGREPRQRMHPWMAAALGAAAMLLCVWGYEYVFHRLPRVDADEAVMVLAHDDSPANIVLYDGVDSFNVSSVDSLSFFEAKDRYVATSEENAGPDIVVREQQPVVQRLSTPRGMDFKVILPDGSEVWLNAESTIEFPSAFTAEERRVVLHGEAFFKVTQNEHCPFIVTTDRMDVHVLGTEFNFRNYEYACSHVSLVKGAVQVYTKDAGQTVAATLKPGEGAWFDKKGELQVGADDIYAVTQWMDGFFYFDNCPLTDVLQELGRWYNLGVIFKRPEVMQYKMHFSASRDGSIEEVVRNLNGLRKVKVVVEGVNLVVY